MRTTLALAIATGSLLSGTVVPASADMTTVYMTTKDSCGLRCTVAMMQIDGSRARVTINESQASGQGSIGWLTRRGNRLTGWMGVGDCSRERGTLQVEGRGSRTHLKGLIVRSKAQAEAFVDRHPNLGLYVPEGPIWTSLRQWRQTSAQFCGDRVTATGDPLGSRLRQLQIGMDASASWGTS